MIECAETWLKTRVLTFSARLDGGGNGKPHFRFGRTEVNHRRQRRCLRQISQPQERRRKRRRESQRYA